MFTTLPESRAPRSRRVGGTIVSVLAHGALIASAVALTLTGQAGASAAPPTPPHDTITFVVPRPPVPRTGTRAPTGQPRETAGRVPAPIDIDIVPPGIPPIDVGAPPVDLDHLVIGRGGQRGLATEGQGDGRALAGTEVIGEREADRAPRVLGRAPEPRFPESMRAAGIAGRVTIQFVVDTAGRAEPGSVEVLDATREEFAAAVRAALPRFRFAPGEVAGRKVRTRVQLPFDFTLR